MTWDSLRASGALTPRLWGLLAAYYLLTPLSAFADAAAWLLLIRLFAAQASTEAPGVVERVIAALRLPTGGLLASVVGLFLLKAALLVALSALETRVGIHVRRRIQQTCLARLIGGRWEDLRGEQVGRWIGVIIEESFYFTKIVTTAANILYTGLTAALLVALALAIEPKLTLILGLAAVPAWLLLRFLYKIQNRISTRQTEARQRFIGDMTETLSSLFQVKASGEHDSARARGLRRQDEIFRREVQFGYTQGLLTAFNPLTLGCVLLAYGLASAWDTASLSGGMAVFGSVGVLGFRAASQLNLLVGSLGNLSRISGSIEPIHRLVTLRQENSRVPLPEPLVAIRLDAVSYSYGSRRLIEERSARIEKGRLFLITGPSGSGKTTLVNLVVGLNAPASGRILYVGGSGTEYDCGTHRARLGYVPQEVHVFSGTIRDNLDPLATKDDAALWRCLEQSGADGFIRTLGGLEAEVSESGRSLSGGERRRLGIARALLNEPDGLILDEITNGLDEEAKAGLMATVSDLSRRRLVLAISHDRPAFAAAEPTCLELTP